VALIDFDTAGPGPRVWDIAYALYRFVPLSRFEPDDRGELIPYDATLHRKRRRERIRLFCHVYGWEEIAQLPATVEARLTALCAFIEEQARQGDEAFLRMINEGHLDYYHEEIAFHRRHSREYFPD
jgi:thiamine kinase-like enzyme